MAIQRLAALMICLLILLAQPNVLILDEPTNDLDTDMLAAMEDLLDSWPGTLIVVSHDRYFLERVTDQQYAILDQHLRHLPGGVDEYLRLRAAQERGRAASAAGSPGGGSATVSGSAAPAHPGGGSAPVLTGADRRAIEKETQSIERRLSKLGAEIDAVHAQMAVHDHSDFAGLTELTARLGAFETERSALEERWFELTELAG